MITGSMGAGKTSVLGEASDILTLRKISHAAIDLDALGLARLPTEADNRGLMYRNLQSVCKNYADAKITRLLVARAIETRAELELCREVVSAPSVVVCRLMASIETMERRVSMRELGVGQRDYVARVADLNGILDRVALEDFTVSTENRSLTEIAKEMLTKVGWI